MAQTQKQRFWRQHIQAWQAGRLSQAAYCRKHNLSSASFGYWRKRVKADAPPNIVPVVREAPNAGVQLRSPGGWLVVLPASLSLDALRVLMAALP
jgi:hypothetical protein